MTVPEQAVEAGLRQFLRLRYTTNVTDEILFKSAFEAALPFLRLALPLVGVEREKIANLLKQLRGTAPDSPGSEGEYWNVMSEAANMIEALSALPKSQLVEREDVARASDIMERLRSAAELSSRDIQMTDGSTITLHAHPRRNPLLDEAADAISALLTTRDTTLEQCARLCETEADACVGDIVAGDEAGAKQANARAGALLTAAADIRALSALPHTGQPQEGKS